MIFVDTSFWAAVTMPRDARHAEAVALMEREQAQVLFTSNHVRGETWTLVLRRVGHWAALDFLDRLERSRVEIVHVDPEVEDDALRWLRRHDERDYSFVDGTSFALMRAAGVQRALAFDGDFTAAGFVELRV